MRWPWQKKTVPPQWYEIPGYVRLPMDSKVSIVQWNNDIQQDVIVCIEKGQVSVYVNKGTYLNSLVATIHLVEVQVWQ